MEILNLLSAFGLSASAGLNAYIPLLVVALLAKFTSLIQLGKPWDALTSWWTIGILVILSLIEFFADKVPAVNHVNDLLHTIIRPAAGAIVFAASTQAVTNINPVLALILGLFVSGGVHAAKSLAIRPAVTAMTGGAGNIPVSILEDLVSTVTSVLAVLVPILIGFFLILIAIFLIWFAIRRRKQAGVKRVLAKD
ncbi:MAG: DUF4126 domain-containing protein [Anaerolineaceae bacterium]|nr:DUF4126 domain-containing protein [Anaerolineaceae bacterium]